MGGSGGEAEDGAAATASSRTGGGGGREAEGRAGRYRLTGSIHRQRDTE